MISRLLLAVSVTFLVSIMSCTPQKSPRSTMPDDGRKGELTEDSLPSLPAEIAPGGFVVEDPLQIVYLADTVATNAEIFALEGKFEQAHSLFLISLDLIETLNREGELDSLVNYDRVFNRIAEFYVDLLPPSYLDSVPPPISSFVTRYQLYDMLNEMDSMSLDSSSIPYLCDESVNYNIPITYNERVQKALTALLSSRKKRWIEKLLNRAEYYRPFMNEMFIEAGLPTDLTFLPMLESAFNPKAYSPAHASGLWQFIPSTGRIYNLRENYWVDERRDPVKATKAAIGYFTRLHNMFDDWYLSLASYNCGEGRVSRTMRRTGAEEYWDLKLPNETMKYVPLFIAYQIISKNPHCFGLEVDTTTAPYDYDTVSVSDCIDLHKIAEGVGSTYDSLKTINPHIKQWCTPPNMKNVTIYIPKGTKSRYDSFYAGLSDKDKVNWYRYKIKNGDVLGVIADRFNVSLSALKSINKMKSNRIIAGRHIFVPIPANSAPEVVVASSHSSKANYKGKRITHKIKKGESIFIISQKYGVTVDQICKWNSIKNPSKISIGQKLYIFDKAVPSKTPAGDKQYYTVKSGESLFIISQKLGVTVNQLAEWNDKPSKKPIIHPGEKLLFFGSPVINNAAQTVAKETKPQTTAVKTTGKKQHHTVQAGESLYSISQNLGVTVKDLANWNKKSADRPVIHPGEKLVYYSTGVSKPQTKVKTETSKGAKKTYLVKKGESLYSISRIIGASVSDIAVWNGKDPQNPTIYPGEKLTYYSSGTTKAPASQVKTGESTTRNRMKYRVKKGDTIFGIAQTFGVSTNDIFALNKLSKSSSIHPGDIIYIPIGGTQKSSSAKTKMIKYRIKSGDNLWSIASTFNVPIREICEASGITKNSALHPGETLNIPVKE